jgi:WD40 repeat protein
MPKIVISYRREDSLGITGRIFDRLCILYGKNSVFMDIHGIADGEDFRKRIAQALRKCDVLLVIIGPKWLGPGPDYFRINEENDPVRIEVETALRRNIPILPVLVDGAGMPPPKQLPERLRKLAYLQAPEVDLGRDFDPHIERLTRSINRILESSKPPSRRAARRRKSIAAVVSIWTSKVWQWTVRKRLHLALAGAAWLILAFLWLFARSDLYEISKTRLAQWLSGPAESGHLPQPASPPKVAQQLPVPPTVGPKPTTVTASLCGSPATDRPAAAPMGGPLAAVAIRPVLSGAQPLRAIVVSPDGTGFATSGDDGLVRLWEAAAFRPTAQIRAHQAPAYSVAYWTDGSLLASAGWDGKVRIWNTSNGQLIHTFEAEVDKKPVKQYGVAFYPAKTLWYVDSAGADGSIWIWDVQQNALKKRPSHEGAEDPTVRSLSFAPNASGEFVSGGFDGTIKFFLDTGKVESVDAHTGKVLRVAYAPDGRRVASAGADKGLKNLKVWNVKGRSFFKSYDGHADYVVSAAWSQDGRWLASGGGGKDTSIRLWEVETGKQLHRYVGHQKDVESLAFSSAGDRLMSASEDKTIKLWDVASEKELLTIVPFEDGEYVAYMPNGCYTGSSRVHGHIKALVDGVEGDITDQQRNALFVPGGLPGLATGR